MGESNSRLNLPANISAANFLSVTLYEAENASGLANCQLFPALGSRDQPCKTRLATYSCITSHWVRLSWTLSVAVAEGTNSPVAIGMCGNELQFQPRESEQKIGP
jgi:hypothetical protein